MVWVGGVVMRGSVLKVGLGPAIHVWNNRNLNDEITSLCAT